MNKTLIQSYIEKIKLDDIRQFAISQNVFLEDEELQIIYNYIKNDNERFFKNPEGVLMEIQGKVRGEVFAVINELYNRYRFFLG